MLNVFTCHTLLANKCYYRLITLGGLVGNFLTFVPETPGSYISVPHTLLQYCL
jgi:hypothetical protein